MSSTLPDTANSKTRRSHSAAAQALLLAFLGLAALTFYLLLIPWTGLATTDYNIPEVTAIASSACLFGNRFVVRTRRQRPMSAAFYAFADAFGFVGILALAAWTLVFPLLYPFPPEIVVIGVFALLLTSAMFVVVRFVQPGGAARQEGAYSNVEVSLRQLGESIEALSKRIPHDQKNVDPAVAERLASMISEVAAMRKEFATLRSPGSGGGAYAPNSGVSSLRIAQTVSKSMPREPITVVKPLQSPPPERDSGTGTPDSTVDNPWSSVLNRRKSKK